MLAFEEAFEVEKLFGGNLVFEMGEPALMKGIDLELEELLLLRRQSCDPFCLVEFERGWLGCRGSS